MVVLAGNSLAVAADSPVADTAGHSYSPSHLVSASKWFPMPTNPPLRPLQPLPGMAETKEESEERLSGRPKKRTFVVGIEAVGCSNCTENC